jgi:hypothetical protein
MTNCVIDAAQSRDGLLSFCPINDDGDIITGVSFIGDTVPDGWNLMAVWHEDGDVAAEKWCADNRAVLEGLK